jgi:hypothetical protein
MVAPESTTVAIVESNGQTPATSAVLGALANLAGIMVGIRATLERREKLSPGVFRPPFTSSLRLRVIGIVVSTNAGQLLQLRAGSDPILNMRPLVATDFLQFPVTLDRGVDVRVFDPATGTEVIIDPVAGPLIEFAIVAYTE